MIDKTALIGTDESPEYDSLEKMPYDNEEYRSSINIPLSHHNYSLMDPYLNQLGTNNHTAKTLFVQRSSTLL